MSETLAVAAIVILATGHLAYRYLPRTWFSMSGGKAVSAHRIAVTAAGCGSGCSSCGGCGALNPSANRRNEIIDSLK